MHRLIVSVGLIVGLIIFGCHGGDSNEMRVEEMMKKKIEQIMQQHTPEWMATPGVVGVGIGENEGKPCIKIFVVEKSPKLEKMLPDSIEDVRVVVQVTGEFNAHGDSAG